MDAVANLASELAASEKPAPLVLNLVHPNPTSWRAILGDVNSVLGDKMKFVPLEQWVSALEEKAAKADRKAIEELVCPGPPFHFRRNSCTMPAARY